MTNDIAVVVGYIMYYDLLEDKIRGSFFSKIDEAIEIAKEFCKLYSKDFPWRVELDFEETLNEYLL